jgi:hypothetical protein
MAGVCYGRDAKAMKEAPVKTVRVRVFYGPSAALDAAQARNVLASSGIPAVLPGEALVEILPFQEHPLLVRAEDAERASAILKDYFDSPEPESRA